MRLRFFAHLQDAAGCAEMELRCDDVNADGLWRALLASKPGLAPFHRSVRLAKNSEYAASETRFYETDEVAFIPPVSGG